MHIADIYAWLFLLYTLRKIFDIWVKCISFPDIPDVDDQVVNVDDKTPDTDQLNPFPMEIPIAFNTEDGVQVSFVLTK